MGQLTEGGGRPSRILHHVVVLLLWWRSGALERACRDTGEGRRLLLVKAKFHYAIRVADRSEDGRRPAASWNLAYHLAR